MLMCTSCKIAKRLLVCMKEAQLSFCGSCDSFSDKPRCMPVQSVEQLISIRHSPLGVTSPVTGV